MSRVNIKAALGDESQRRRLTVGAIQAIICAEIHEVSREYCEDLYDRVQEAKKCSCDGCGAPMSMSEHAAGWTVCLECTKARHRAVLKRKCCCGRKRRPTEVMRTGSRSWISCHRCLGQIKQLS